MLILRKIFYSLQIAKALGAQQATDDQWEAFKETTGDTSNLTE